MSAANIKSASNFGTHRKRTIDEFIGENLVLLNFAHITETHDGKSLGDKDFFVVNIRIENTGELAHFLSSHTYVRSFLESIGSPDECPVAFRVYKTGKAFAIGDWE